MTSVRGKLTSLLLVSQVLFIILFAVFVDYDKSAGPRRNEGNGTAQSSTSSHGVDIDVQYPMFQDIHVMVAVGFGFLMTFLKHHGFGSVGFNFLLTCHVLQWSLLVNGWFDAIGNDETTIAISIVKLEHADFAAAAVLISFGAILGRVSPLQLIVMAMLEVVFYNINIFLGTRLLAAVDVGGSIFLHAFGAYFGLAVARILFKTSHTRCKRETSTYHADLFAMIGTLFLWMFWPSFNAGPASGNERHRAVINTVLSLAASSVATFAISAVVDKKNKLNMVHIQNATLAGGVAIGASANFIVRPWGALLVGTVAGSLSTLGYQYLQPVLMQKLKIHDTCGVHNLHGIPGVLGGVVSIICCACIPSEHYNESYEAVFGDGSRSSAGSQASMQLYGLLITLGMALASGALTGMLLKLRFFDNLGLDEIYDDAAFWLVEDAPSYKEEDDDPEVKIALETASH